MAKNDFDRLGLFTTIGYSPYTNSNDVRQALTKYLSEPQNGNLLDDVIQNEYLYDNRPANILYLKSSIETDASIRLSRLVDSQKIKAIIDDPNEVFIQSFPWYIKNILNSNGIIANFLSDIHKNNRYHNAKCSFVCGLAYGLGMPILMLAPDPFISPLDYKDLMKTYTTANRCEESSHEWFDLHSVKLNNRPTYERNIKNELRAQSELQRINIGDSVAENEFSDLSTYFVRTASFDDALRSNHSIFVGRKGSGKTANLYAIAEELDTAQNHVCVIKPVAYEIEGIIQIMQNDLKLAEIGYLVESLWKFLIYTELAKSIFSKLSNRPAHYILTEDETQIIDYVNTHREIIMPEFSMRLDYAVCNLKHIEQQETSGEQKIKISEALHDKIINRLRSILGNHLVNKDKVAILIDNLDKAWGYGTDLQLIGKFIFGLLDVGESIIRDFSKEDHWRNPVKVSLIIFLREDIYTRISKYATEKDKLPIKPILWEDHALLLRVIEERMVGIQNIDIWKKYFCSEVKGIAVKEYIVNTIMPKPRDIITYVKAALNYAVSRKHGIINEEDIVDAENDYSKHAYFALITENGNEIPELDDILIQLAGVNELITENDLVSALHDSNIKDVTIDRLVDVLCQLSFLGLEISPDRFEFT